MKTMPNFQEDESALESYNSSKYSSFQTFDETYLTNKTENDISDFIVLDEIKIDLSLMEESTFSDHDFLIDNEQFMEIDAQVFKIISQNEGNETDTTSMTEIKPDYSDKIVMEHEENVSKQIVAENERNELDRIVSELEEIINEDNGNTLNQIITESETVIGNNRNDLDAVITENNENNLNKVIAENERSELERIVTSNSGSELDKIITENNENSLNKIITENQKNQSSIIMIQSDGNGSDKIITDSSGSQLDKIITENCEKESDKAIYGKDKTATNFKYLEDGQGHNDKKVPNNDSLNEDELCKLESNQTSGVKCSKEEEGFNESVQVIESNTGDTLIINLTNDTLNSSELQNEEEGYNFCDSNFLILDETGNMSLNNTVNSSVSSEIDELLRENPCAISFSDYSESNNFTIHSELDTIASTLHENFSHPNSTHKSSNAPKSKNSSDAPLKSKNDLHSNSTPKNSYNSNSASKNSNASNLAHKNFDRPNSASKNSSDPNSHRTNSTSKNSFDPNLTSKNSHCPNSSGKNSSDPNLTSKNKNSFHPNSESKKSDPNLMPKNSFHPNSTSKKSKSSDPNFTSKNSCRSNSTSKNSSNSNSVPKTTCGSNSTSKNPCQSNSISKNSRPSNSKSKNSRRSNSKNSSAPASLPQTSQVNSACNSSCYSSSTSQSSCHPNPITQIFLCPTTNLTPNLYQNLNPVNLSTNLNLISNFVIQTLNNSPKPKKNIIKTWKTKPSKKKTRKLKFKDIKENININNVNCQKISTHVPNKPLTIKSNTDCQGTFPVTTVNKTLDINIDNVYSQKDSIIGSEKLSDIDISSVNSHKTSTPTSENLSVVNVNSINDQKMSSTHDPPLDTNISNLNSSDKSSTASNNQLSKNELNKPTAGVHEETSEKTRTSEIKSLVGVNNVSDQKTSSTLVSVEPLETNSNNLNSPEKSSMASKNQFNQLTKSNKPTTGVKRVLLDNTEPNKKYRVDKETRSLQNKFRSKSQFSLDLGKDVIDPNEFADNTSPSWSMYRDELLSNFEKVQRQWANPVMTDPHVDLTCRAVVRPHRHFSNMRILGDRFTKNIHISSLYNETIESLDHKINSMIGDLVRIANQQSRRYRFLKFRVDDLINKKAKLCAAKNELEYLHENYYDRFRNMDALYFTEYNMLEVVEERNKVCNYEDFYGLSE